ncbi:large conductance mechanosensitive channel protein MscL [Micromonospora sp. PLK6-60]|uniref:large conductance mechanosensitive channel protein MscL n=1 Tax=Micromonospora sp. PLK6-60 TaxID=2873383 RepID=UPI001CA61485|nr:large conductance mechanosensitive channel protein MscL [Micromonospora sp. PLK6-60]MBY8871994.1 large conductance mechanosensitive channel protein MscL [Micromonospora sp. PLK6-60]
MLKGFKDFIMRGNVVDLAVGIVIGAAFTGLVTQFTKSFLEPLIRALGGGEDQFSGSWEITKDNYIDWAAFVNAIITFLLTAAVLYFLVVYPMNRLAERRRRGEEPPPAAPSEEVKLLTEIRDALVAAGQAAPGQAVPGQHRGALDDVLGRRTDPPAPR